MSDELKLVMELAQAVAEKEKSVLKQEIKEWQGELREAELDEEEAAEGRGKRLLVKKIRDLKENIAKAEAALKKLRSGEDVATKLAAVRGGKVPAEEKENEYMKLLKPTEV